MKRSKILILPGDGIGAEIMPHVIDVLETAVTNAESDHALEFSYSDIGGCAIDKHGVPLPGKTLELAKASQAILMGAVGGPQWDALPMDERPERGLLGLRSGLDLYANLRPAVIFKALADSSSLKRELVENLDVLIIRELTGGIYFGEPRGITIDNGGRRGFNTLVYDEREIERIARNAFEAAQKRSQKLCSVDKANVLEVTQLWRDVVTEVHRDYQDVELSHMYVDNAAMQLVREPKQFDVIVTGNMFGDILSDVAAMLTGSLGMLPSASLNSKNQGLYEPVHGSAPDIAGKNIANPLATILSGSMLLRYSLNAQGAADLIEGAVEEVLEIGMRTADIMPSQKTQGLRLVGTDEMAEAVKSLL